MLSFLRKLKILQDPSRTGRWKVSKLNEQITSRDLRKLRNNPKFFLKHLSDINWSVLANFVDVDEMEDFWTTEINKCLMYVNTCKNNTSTGYTGV